MGKRTGVSFGPRAALAALLAIAGAALGQTDVFWDQPADGFWNDPANWNPQQVPNNAGPNTFNAFIDVFGVPFSVTLDLNLDVTLTGFELTSPDATLTGAGGNTLTVLGAALVADGVVSNVGLFTSEGSLVLTDARLESLTLDSTGTLEFSGAGCDDICDSDINKIGGAADWNAGDIALEGTATFTLSGAAEFRVNTDATLTGDPGTLFDTGDGTILKASAGLTLFSGLTLNNTGTLDVAAGTFTTDGVDVNGNANTLAGGTWIVRDGALLDLIAQQAIINAADVTIEGSAQFPAITDNIEVIAPPGRLALDTAPLPFTTPGDFTNDGELVLGPAQTVTVSGLLTNFNQTTGELAGGTFDVGLGELRFAGASIAILSSTIRVGTPAGIANLAGDPALPALAEISPGALARLFGGGLFATQPQTLLLDGQLIVGELADATVFLVGQGGAGGETIEQTGTLTLDGDPATASGATVRVADNGLGTITLLDPAALIEGSGLIEASVVSVPVGMIAPGRSAGRLVFSQSDVQIGPDAIVDIEIGGEVEGAERDFIVVDAGTWQHAGGALAGTLNVSLIDGFVPPQGQFFEVLTASEGVIGAFEGVNYDGPGSLTFLPGPDSFSVFICPADCNQDGRLDVTDFQCFQVQFSAGDDDADMNGDGALNVLDFIAFQKVWQAGCDF